MLKSHMLLVIKGKKTGNDLSFSMIIAFVTHVKQILHYISWFNKTVKVKTKSCLYIKSLWSSSFGGFMYYINAYTDSTYILVTILCFQHDICIKAQEIKGTFLSLIHIFYIYKWIWISFKYYTTLFVLLVGSFRFSPANRILLRKFIPPLAVIKANVYTGTEKGKWIKGFAAWINFTFCLYLTFRSVLCAPVCMFEIFALNTLLRVCMRCPAQVWSVPSRIKTTTCSSFH